MSEYVENELISDGNHHLVYWFMPLPDYLAIPHGNVITFTYPRNMIDALDKLHSENRCDGESVMSLW